MKNAFQRAFSITLPCILGEKWRIPMYLFCSIWLQFIPDCLYKSNSSLTFWMSDTPACYLTLCLTLDCLYTEKIVSIRSLLSDEESSSQQRGEKIKWDGFMKWNQWIVRSNHFHSNEQYRETFWHNYWIFSLVPFTIGGGGGAAC